MFGAVLFSMLSLVSVGEASEVMFVNGRSGLCMTVRNGAPAWPEWMIQKRCDLGDDQRFEIQDVFNHPSSNALGQRILNVGSGLCLDAVGRYITTQHCGAWGSQKWNLLYFKEKGTATRALADVQSGEYIDVPNGSTSEGTYLQRYTWHSGQNQHWIIVELP